MTLSDREYTVTEVASDSFVRGDDVVRVTCVDSFDRQSTFWTDQRRQPSLGDKVRITVETAVDA